MNQTIGAPGRSPMPPGAGGGPPPGMVMSRGGRILMKLISDLILSF